MLSFIICTYNRDKYIYQCLDHLAQNKYWQDWEIVLVDNNSTDKTAVECQRFIEKYPTIEYHYFLEKQQGLSFARNRGIKEANGEWLVFLDDDAIVEQDYVTTLLGHLQNYPNIGAFGGAIEPWFEEGEPNWYSKWAMGFVSAIDRGDKIHIFPENKFPIGANMGIRREVIDKVGLFNTELGRIGNNLLAGEEKDLFNRIREAGFQILYFPGIKVKHCIPVKRTTSDFVARLAYGIGVSECLRTRKEGGRTYYKRLFMECIKWVGTIILWIGYSIRFKPAKGNILMLFRYNVTKGLVLV